MSVLLSDYLQQQQQKYAVTPHLPDVITSISQACLHINREIRLGALDNILGSAHTGNIQGEEQKKLDVLSNQIMIDTLSANPAIAGLASEEEDSFVTASQNGQFLVLFDPLDGSSNIDVNISIGTIFSVLAKPDGALTTESFLQSGRQQLASGYVLYGPQTILVLTLKHGIAMFTLNEHNQFQLTQENPQIPVSTAEFAINMSNQRHWQPAMQNYIAQLLAGKSGCRGKDYNMRWVASMVAEVHRILIRGGIFTYPQDNRNPDKPGKLRLMYEANPMSLLVEQAQGAATNTRQNILDIPPEGLHQRVAVVLGSKEEVDYVTAMHNAD
ncbi:fructose-bisphosphatase class I [Snodgrassella alvi]|uniref:class 1 fructose-bisphosphatase n=1 Tax=Snodgrassella alvi TaxID=1196083 RepID=UPI000A05EC0E|nr:class 1 fructose-bisphosphatase [Snodgrassella alvi]ORF25328.1 fructose-bisphosphatase class I [Snodgrassella alvi]ORF30691.1 fructose-bisphosphatase class I [Snodgrassella alvi]ORF34225.1 fructose-bisphosphatase class I [Snodgrassella alvi]ORF38749.1 fructose-bisphosphatase class I [Snodgrassella alvi]ORF38895.1 fructose-bisphosphatase class I [Snodgrassella alvi]